MSSDLIVQRYSQALFETTEQAETTDQTAKELNEAVKAFADADVVSFFASPFNNLDTKVMVAKSALEGKCSPPVFNFIITVVEKERIEFLQQINESYQAMVSAKDGESEGTLYVSSDVSPEFKSQVENKLSAKLNKKIKLNVQKDASLLSGFKVTVGGWTLDDSGSFHLNKIKEEISKRGI